LEQRSSREARQSQLVKKFPEFKGTWRFITARIAIFCAITQVVSFLHVFPRKPCMHFSFHPWLLLAPPASFFSIWSPEYLVQVIKVLM
jgi:hypothetical protein